MRRKNKVVIKMEPKQADQAIALVKLIQGREISCKCSKVGVALTPIGEEC